MKREVLRKAKELEEDIRLIEGVLNEHKNRRWIKVVGARFNEDLGQWYSVRFQNELAKWLEDKKQEYEKEFKEL